MACECKSVAGLHCSTPVTLTSSDPGLSCIQSILMCSYVNERWSQIQQRVLVLASDQDWLIPSKEEGRRLKQKLPRCRLKVLTIILLHFLPSFQSAKEYVMDRRPSWKLTYIKKAVLHGVQTALHKSESRFGSVLRLFWSG